MISEPTTEDLSNIVTFDIGYVLMESVEGSVLSVLLLGESLEVVGLPG